MSPLVQSLLRHILQSAASALAAYLVAHQVVNGADVATITATFVSGGMALATAAWGAWANRKAGLVHAVAAMPEVDGVQVSNSEAGVKLSIEAGSTTAAPVTVRTTREQPEVSP